MAIQYPSVFQLQFNPLLPGQSLPCRIGQPATNLLSAKGVNKRRVLSDQGQGVSLASVNGPFWKVPEHGLLTFASPGCLKTRVYPCRRPARVSCKLNTSGTAEPDNGGTESGASGMFGPSQWTNPGGQGKDLSADRGTEDDANLRLGPWDLAARRKRLQEAASKMGDPFKGMVTRASRKLQDYFDKHKGINEKTDSTEKGESSETGDWEQWKKVFIDVEQKYSLLEALQFQMDEAVDQEDYKEAARLKAAFDGCAAGDPMATSLAELERSLKDERYEEAAQIRDQTAIDLIGWWGGVGEDEDPYGRIINITPMQGRLIARSYTAKHLAAAREGKPLFEIFVSMDEAGNYINQPVYLQRNEGMPPLAPPTLDVPSSSDTLLGSDGPAQEEMQQKDGKGAEDAGDADASVDALAKIMGFLKDKMPGMKSQVIHVINPGDLSGDTQNMVEQVLKKIAEAAGDANESRSSGETNRDGISGAGSDRDSNGASTWREDSGASSSGRGNESVVDEDGGLGGLSGAENLDLRVSVHVEVADAAEAGVRLNRIPRPPERVPARIERKGRDAFAFHIEGQNDLDTLAALKESSDRWKMSATVLVQGGEGNTLPGELGKKKSWSMDKLPVKPEHLERIMRLAVQQARRSELPKTTNFQRINVDDANADPLSGLYIGAFGPYTSEVVQLRRKFGRWEGDDSSVPYEYVEAVKLTGDLNVPAGEVTFRAKIGRHQRLSYQGIYPEELGVTARYKGQGRLAEVGFKNPRWIDGELVLLDGKLVVGGPNQASGPTNGAELGFVYSVPERHFLVLFNRLKLKNN